MIGSLLICLFLGTSKRVTAVVGRYNLSSEEIKDITQETFIKAYRSIDRFRETVSFTLGFTE